MHFLITEDLRQLVPTMFWGIYTVAPISSPPGLLEFVLDAV